LAAWVVAAGQLDHTCTSKFYAKVKPSTRRNLLIADKFRYRIVVLQFTPIKESKGEFAGIEIVIQPLQCSSSFSAHVYLDHG